LAMSECSDLPTSIQREEAPPGKVANLMVCVDGSTNSRDAFDLCIKRKRANDRLLIVTAPELISEFSILHPWQHTETVNLQLMANGDKLCQVYANLAKELGVTNWSVHNLEARKSSAKQVVADFATEKHVDTIFVGSRGLNFLQNLFMGSFSKFLVHNAPCNVFVVKPKTKQGQNPNDPEISSEKPKKDVSTERQEADAAAERKEEVLLVMKPKSDQVMTSSTTSAESSNAETTPRAETQLKPKWADVARTTKKAVG